MSECQSRNELVIEYQRLAKEAHEAHCRSMTLEREFLEKKVLNKVANAALANFEDAQQELRRFLMKHHAELVAPVSEKAEWVPCSDHDRLPNCDDVDIVLGWFPGMKHPRACSPEEIKHWALDADPIPGAMWKPYPEAPNGK